MERDRIRDNEPFWRWLAKSFAMPALLATPARAVAVPPSRLDQATLQKLTALLGPAGVLVDEAERAQHATDALAARHGEGAPDVVLFPRSAGDVLAILKICSEMNIAVTAGHGMGGARPLAVLDLSAMGRVVQVDPISGLVEAEAGINGAQLARQLAARGVTLDADFESSLGQRAASGGTALHSVTLATPQGLLTLDADLVPLAAHRIGIVTAATLRLKPVPAHSHRRAWLFRDFAAGLAALREAARAGVSSLRLCDDGATRLARALADNDVKHRLFDALLAYRGFDGGAARLEAEFSGSETDIAAALRRVTAIARRLGAQADPLWQGTENIARHGGALLDRGVGTGQFSFTANWADLPLRYTVLRSALKQAMRANAPLPGAHGIVLAEVSGADAQGARLTVNWLYPRKLDDEVAQAAAIRAAALAAAEIMDEGGLKPQMLRAIRQTLDPKGILQA